MKDPDEPSLSEIDGGFFDEYVVDFPTAEGAGGGGGKPSNRYHERPMMVSEQPPRSTGGEYDYVDEYVDANDPYREDGGDEKEQRVPEAEEEEEVEVVEEEEPEEVYQPHRPRRPHFPTSSEEGGGPLGNPYGRFLGGQSYGGRRPPQFPSQNSYGGGNSYRSSKPSFPRSNFLGGQRFKNSYGGGGGGGHGAPQVEFEYVFIILNKS